MGEMAQKISTVDREELLKVLNEAFAEEWLAYYQYWIGAQVIEGPLRPTIEEEFLEHAKEELEHAQLISDRIIQLGGTPLLSPSDWERHAKCRYEAPTDEFIVSVLKQNHRSEQCAIARYQAICEMCKGKDIATFHMARHILDEELEHEHDIEDWMKDIELTYNKP